MGFGFVAGAADAQRADHPRRRDRLQCPVSLAPLPGRAGAPRRQAPTPAGDGYEAISHEDFVYALSQMDSFIDISEEDLLRIYSLATGRTATCCAGRGRGRQPFCAFLEGWRNPTLLVVLFGDEAIEQQRVFGRLQAAGQARHLLALAVEEDQHRPQLARVVALDHGMARIVVIQLQFAEIGMGADVMLDVFRLTSGFCSTLTV
jgi:hypothetical protein